MKSSSGSQKSLHPSKGTNNWLLHGYDVNTWDPHPVFVHNILDAS